MAFAETFTLTVNGQRYERWEEIRVTREIDRMCTDFNIAVSERFLAGAADFALAPFMPCTAAIGGDVVLTGYIDNYLPEVEADRHTVRITGRSKTEDIIDCTPDIQGGQFAGYKLDAIARAIGSQSASRIPSTLWWRSMSAPRFPMRRLNATKQASPSWSGYAACVRSSPPMTNRAGLC